MTTTEKVPLSQKPTVAMYHALQVAFDYFNEQLFDGELPDCVITLRSSNRVEGYFHFQRFISPAGEVIDEIGIHPGYFTLQSIEEVLATLVHEMVHLWQHHHGKPGKSTAHNREWANKMISIGLQPSKNRLPGGAETGRTMSDYILPSGGFLAACRALLATGFGLPWLDRYTPVTVERLQMKAKMLKDEGIDLELTPSPTESLPAQCGEEPSFFPPNPPKEKTRFRYSCESCATVAWAAAETSLVCGGCMGEMRLR